MTQTAVGDGPVVFFTGQGQQVMYPLTAITFEAGEPQVTSPPASPDDAQALTAWLKFLAKEGRIAPRPVPPPGDAMVVTAAEPGAAGNRITVTVEPTTDRTIVNVTISSIDVYPGATLDTLGDLLDARPGVVQVKSVGTLDPVDGPAAAAAGTPPSWEAGSAAGTPSFTVEARRAGTDPARVTVGVTAVTGPTGHKTFTLTATWQLPRMPVTVATMPALVTAAAFVVHIEPPAGGVYQLPTPGTVTLGGGAELAPATAASATILAS